MEKPSGHRAKGSGLDWTESLSVDEADGGPNNSIKEGLRSLSSSMRVRAM